MKKRLVIYALLLATSACESPIGGFPQNGSYIGFYNHQQVQASLQQTADHEFTLSFAAQNGQGSTTWTLNSENFHPISTSDQTPMDNTCFSSPESKNDGKNEGANSIRLCWSPNEIHWTEQGPDGAQLASLDLTRLLDGQLPTLEQPRSYALDELITRAKKRNFQSVVQFQQMIMAKDSATNAYLNLLPHGNSTDAFNILSGSTYTELKSIGDLVPFLLPSRWFRAAAQNDMAAAEKDSWEIMDLDGVNFVESFAFASARDSAALSSMGSERAMIAGLRDFVRGKEQAGLAPLGTSDDLSSLINKIDLSSSDLRTLQSDDLSAVSQSAGFYNPMAVESVTFKQDPDSPSAGDPLKVDFDTEAKLAVSRSIELRQMDDLLSWAKNEDRARIFDWMDSSGNSDGGLGIGLPSYIEVGKDQVDVIQAQTAVVKSTLLNNLQTAILQLQKAADDYQLAIGGAEIQERRVLRNSQNLKVGVGFVMSDLIQALQDQVDSQLAEVDAEYGYLLALSRFDRILFQGTYASVAK